jgi:hypothetical protein
MGKVAVVGSYIVAQEIDTDRLPSEGETLIGRNYHVTHGGKGSNMVCAAARLGAQAAFLGKVGRNAFGESFLALLNREGVGVEGAAVSFRGLMKPKRESASASSRMSPRRRRLLPEHCSTWVR